jgi:hypothetical protein
LANSETATKGEISKAKQSNDRRDGHCFLIEQSLT